MSVLAAIEHSAFAGAIRDSIAAFLIIQSLHLLAMALVFGTIVIIDLRLLGLASVTRPFDRMSADIMKWTWVGFGLSAISGALQFITNAQVYVDNTAFRIKVGLLLLAGLNVLLFQLTAWRTVGEWTRSRRAPGLGRAVAVISLLIWLGVIVAGRMIGFTEAETAASEPSPADNINFEELLGLPPANK